MIAWDELAAVVENDYDTSVDRDEGFFVCPFCHKSIYENDYPEIGDYFCPICHEPF